MRKRTKTLKFASRMIRYNINNKRRRLIGYL